MHGGVRDGMHAVLPTSGWLNQTSRLVECIATGNALNVDCQRLQILQDYD